MKHFLFASAFLLNAIGVSVKDFEDWQRLPFLRKFLRHGQGRSQSHHGVKAHVVFTAEGAINPVHSQQLIVEHSRGLLVAIDFPVVEQR